MVDEEKQEYKTAYQKATEELRFLEHKLESWKNELQVIEEVREAFPSLAITTSCGLQNGQIQGALIHLNDLKDMRDAVAVARHLTILGYHTKGFEDYPELRRRTYDYGVIKLMCFLSYEPGAKCQFVEVGKKETPIYKLVCDGDPIVDEANAEESSNG